MKLGIFHIALRSLSHYRKTAFYQFIIIAILAAVIAGSLLTGYSVKESLMESAIDRLGNAGIMISSGIRNFDPELAEKFASESGFPAAAVAETNGFCRSFPGGDRQYPVSVYGTGSGFFSFLGYENLELEQGEVAVNLTLAERLGLSPGDEILLNVNKPDDIADNSPFAPSSDASERAIYRVAAIVDGSLGGDFTPAINQVIPDNVFMNIGELAGNGDETPKANRIFSDYRSRLDEAKSEEILRKVLSPDHIGLRLRRSPKTGENEMVSSRIFIDSEIIEEIISLRPEGKPLITYLVNSIDHGDLSTPYSFIAAVDFQTYSVTDDENSVIINRWLADDLDAGVYDTLAITWYEPGRIKELEERTGRFVISSIAGKSGLWTDSLLMPEFPGIAESESCTDWDAGVEINTDRIRPEDEDYWNKFRGTPKAFISYSKGKELWGNNFGPATAIRFPSEITEQEIVNSLSGNMDPAKLGFAVRDLRMEMINAASESVDFSTLFLSLGFFIIVSCIFLLILAVSVYFDSRREQVYTFFALGFTDKKIRKMLLLETAVISLAGSLAGIAAGVAVNAVIISSLNSVWIGAVQSGTLSTETGIIPLLTAFSVTVLITVIFLLLRINQYLRKLRAIDEGGYKPASLRINLILLLISSAITVLSGILAIAVRDGSPSYSFISGGFLFVSLIFLWRQLVISKGLQGSKMINARDLISRSYYSFYPARAVMPVLLIAAGLFAVIITGMNRLQITEKSLSEKGGTGGFKLWARTVAPVTEDLNTQGGRRIHGLDDPEISGITFVQARVSGGDDASCLNLNHVSSPPIAGIDPGEFIKRGSFSFATLIKEADRSNPWEIITRKPDNECIYGFADQTVMQWGLKKKTGDTLKFRSETGQLYNVILAGGLKSSVFQGYLLVSEANFVDYHPSVSGYSLFLADYEGRYDSTMHALLRTRFEPYGIDVMPAKDKLASFFRVTNTYLSVFVTLGGFGLILGVAGLGFVLRQNYNSRKREFALMLASGYTNKSIRKYISREQLFILSAGVVTGLLSAFMATWPSVRSGSELPWISILLITLSIAFTGLAAIAISVRNVGKQALIQSLRRE